jgi:hypothetical protein
MTCGGGIHGWPWAMGLGDGKECDWSALWQVYAVSPKDIMGGDGDLKSKVKFRTGILRFVGTWDAATAFVLAGQMSWVHHAASGAASATGKDGTAMSVGPEGVASASLGNFIILAEWEIVAGAWKRMAMRLAKVDGRKIKADTPYKLKDGKFVEAH